MNVREVMSAKVQTVGEEDDLELALQVMLWCGFRHVPVVRKGELVGILSHRDVLAERADAARGVARPKEMRVRDAMRRSVQTIGPEEDVIEAAIRMASGKIGCLPVVDKGKLIGIVTTTDLLAQFAAASAVRETTTGPLVSAAMTKDPATVGPDDDLFEAVSVLVEEGVRHLPVVDSKRRVIGILSDRDVRGAIGDPVLGLKQHARVTVGEMTVSSVMTPDPITLHADSPLDDAIALFVDERVGALPIVDKEDRLLGILSYLDVLRYHRNRQPRRAAKKPARATTATKLGPRKVRGNRTTHA